MPFKPPSTRNGIRTLNGYLSAEEINRRFQDRADQQELVTRCLHCEWLHEGTAGDGRILAVAHRAHAHPWLKRKTKQVKPVGFVSVERLAAGRDASLRIRAEAE